MQATEIDLTPWCSGLLCYSIAAPFVKKGYRYATDAHKVIRMKSAEPDTKFDEKPPPDCAMLFATFDRHDCQGEFAPWPSEAGLVEELRPCQTCDGEGSVGKEDCPECDGSGIVECPHCGSDDECEECDGEGSTGGEKCQTCDGKRELKQPWWIRCGSLQCRVDHYRAVAALPNPRFLSCHEARMILVKFDGGEAIVMSLEPG